MQTPITMEGLA